MKTPQQTAARALEIYSEKWRDEFGARPLNLPIDDAALILIAGAIEADRAQHEAAKRYVVMVRGTGKNKEMPEAEIGRYDNRIDAQAVANHWNACNGKHGFEYWMEEEG